MLERFALALVLSAAGWVAYRLFTHWQMGKAAHPADPLLTGAPHVPTVLYFTTPTCIPCRTTQTPALERLKSELGDALHVVRVDAEADPEAASRWGVMTVPTLFVLNADGTPRKVYNGVVPAATLKQDLQAAS
ncbi:MAG: thioredoxin family protein [Anaerolineae bacterium]|jgi:thioredoxin-like negative regulator of GroEL|nr:thioredoxin family protein [Anaerolineae bacterium]